MEDLGPVPGLWSLVFGIPPSFSSDEEPNSSISGKGCKPVSFPSASSSAGVRGPCGDFWISGLLGVPRGTVSNSPKELKQCQNPPLRASQSLPSSWLVPHLSQTQEEMERSAGRAQAFSVKWPERTSPSSSTRPESLHPPVSVIPASAARSNPPFRATKGCHSPMEHSL